MNEILYKSRLNAPVVTGSPLLGQRTVKPQTTVAEQSFKTEFLKHLETEEGLTVSKHAAQRIEERGISITDESMTRLISGIELAKQKGLKDTLIIVDTAAFIVNTASSTVITAMGGNELKGNVVTNISGTVIV